MSWSSRRQTAILTGVILVIFLPLGLFLYLTFHKPPSCFDGKYNGDEEGIDCGGGCALLCRAESVPPVVVWQNFFEVSPGVYNVMAYVENPNPDAGVVHVPYTFRLFDRSNVLLMERRGVTKIKPKQITPILENGVFTDQLRPSYVELIFEEDFVWEKMEPQEQIIVVESRELQSEDSKPRVVASIMNSAVFPVANIKVIVILYSENENVLGVSSTFVNELKKNERKTLFFTWPQIFPEKVSRIEIILVYELSG